MSKPQSILVCSDAHHPSVDPLAWSTFLEVGRRCKPDILVVIGDFGDFYSVMGHRKNPNRKELLEDELKLVRKARRQLDALGVKRKVFVCGNHEFRLDRYLADNAPELWGLVSVPQVLELKDNGWEYVPYGESISIGKMDLSHEVGRCGKNAARQSLDDYGDNITIGHTHRGGTAYGGTVAGKKHVCLNVGWLGDYDAIDYKHRRMALREWQHGFGWIEQDSAGYSWCQFIPIIEGRCIVNGRIVNGRKRAA